MLVDEFCAVVPEFRHVLCRADGVLLNALPLVDERDLGRLLESPAYIDLLNGLQVTCMKEAHYRMNSYLMTYHVLYTFDQIFACYFQCTELD